MVNCDICFSDELNIISNIYKIDGGNIILFNNTNIYSYIIGYPTTSTTIYNPTTDEYEIYIEVWNNDYKQQFNINKIYGIYDYYDLFHIQSKHFENLFYFSSNDYSGLVIQTYDNILTIDIIKYDDLNELYKCDIIDKIGLLPIELYLNSNVCVECNDYYEVIQEDENTQILKRCDGVIEKKEIVNVGNVLSVDNTYNINIVLVVDNRDNSQNEVIEYLNNCQFNVNFNDIQSGEVYNYIEHININDIQNLNNKIFNIAFNIINDLNKNNDVVIVKDNGEIVEYNKLRNINNYNVDFRFNILEDFTNICNIDYQPDIFKSIFNSVIEYCPFIFFNKKDNPLYTYLRMNTNTYIRSRNIIVRGYHRLHTENRYLHVYYITTPIGFTYEEYLNIKSIVYQRNRYPFNYNRPDLYYILNYDLFNTDNLKRHYTFVSPIQIRRMLNNYIEANQIQDFIELYQIVMFIGGIDYLEETKEIVIYAFYPHEIYDLTHAKIRFLI